jgi:hypothetical protein
LSGPVFDLAGEVLFRVLAGTVLFFASPFTSILWGFGLMNALHGSHGRSPLDVILAYMAWVAIPCGLAQAWSNKN